MNRTFHAAWLSLLDHEVDRSLTGSEEAVKSSQVQEFVPALELVKPTPRLGLLLIGMETN